MTLHEDEDDDYYYFVNKKVGESRFGYLKESSSSTSSPYFSVLYLFYWKQVKCINVNVRTTQQYALYTHTEIPFLYIKCLCIKVP